LSNFDAEVRLAAFDWLSQLIEIHGDVLPHQVLAQGFDSKGTRGVFLLDPSFNG